jgi:hypothetical protein
MKSTTSIGRFLIVLLAMVFVAGMLQTAFAQRQGGPRLTPQQQADTLGKKLGLDSVTVAKVAAIYDKSQKDIAAKRTELQGGDMDAMRAAMTEIRTKANDEIKALLTKEQVAKFEDILKEQQQRMMNRPPRNN